MDKDLLFKYNTPGPRYTSYPTVPYWQKTPPQQQKWKELVMKAFQVSNQKEGISLYVHLPFCESLCTYCGCNTRITINHAVETTYIHAVLREWQMYLTTFGESKPLIREIHLGGGTPTFFNPENLKMLILGLLKDSIVHPEAQFGFEAHPGNTTDEHLQTLYELGFRRISIGVQDFNPIVLAIINRHQTYEQVKHLTLKAREIGYTSVNYDIVYGLPFQKACYMMETMQRVIQLKPDRIAFYSYAHVPWIKPGQRNFTEKDLPDADKKMAIYETGRNALEVAGYQDIGMDHFALPSDSLYKAQQEGRLHRNFMGYTDMHTQLLIGLGASAISDSWTGYVQNEKKVEDYYQRIAAGMIPIARGHELTREDLILRRHILRLMTQFETSWVKTSEYCEEVFQSVERLDEMEFDELVELQPFSVKVTEKGKPFIRNICMAFDALLWENKPEAQLFSQTV
ncbi:oxygen-independent coproporphyrinogen III oxidase [Dyadobacter chenwenxiniae]|uniref:Coproporphyrinogen-III oxidase n=1 Tax=Dyadobacter chenwenxiniae TaxID=2906456 RepID=A0A9X1PMC6_9BACT|nr:oxygen-independent coproporphyrinogen III oxidase [Dyadobacter chenwenxiniae]MCF0062609.1 oxygen-independent coproporphyrinogen III oxidase [Dyadobacter chenwenxiniae]UON83644.1 oxygen-independent coproporphyrinogen III oxidase [Dyadobacter chenwenxiniae]